MDTRNGLDYLNDTLLCFYYQVKSKWTIKLNQKGEGEKSLTPTDNYGLMNAGDWFTAGLWPITGSLCGYKY